MKNPGNGRMNENERKKNRKRKYVQEDKRDDCDENRQQGRRDKLRKDTKYLKEKLEEWENASLLVKCWQEYISHKQMSAIWRKLRGKYYDK